MPLPTQTSGKPAAIARAAWPAPSPTRTGAGRGGRGSSIVRRIRYPWRDLFDLVLQLERYPEFVPNCRAVKVFSRKVDDQGRTVIVSRMTVGVSMIEVGYANRTIGDRAARRIQVEALDGPLRYLHVAWTFEPDGQDWTQVGFSVDYEFSNRMLAAVASRVFDAMFAEILDAFERRAQRLRRAGSNITTA